MRKSIASFLAILVLLLSGMPCADVFAVADGGHEESMSINGSAHHDDIGCLDDCSPFCQCSCCAGFSLPQQALQLWENCLFTVSKQSFAAHLPGEPAEVHLPIWQPPQLV